MQRKRGKSAPVSDGDVIRRRGHPIDPGTARDALAVELLIHLEGASRREAERVVSVAKLYPVEDPTKVVIPPSSEQLAASLQTAVRQHVKRTRGRSVKKFGPEIGRVMSAHALSWAPEADEIAARASCRRCDADSLPHYHCEQCRGLVGGPNVLRGTVTAALESELVALVCNYTCWDLLKLARAKK